MIKGFQGVIIWTEDLKGLLPFYRDTLGLQAQMESDEFAVLLGEKLLLGQHSEVKGKSRDPKRMMVNLGVDDCQAEYQRLNGKGVQFIREPSQDPGGFTIATFLDPDGNTLQLLQRE